MRCEAARHAISERLDGERLRDRSAAAIEGHLSTCDACRAFERRAWRLRDSSRIALAPAVPDLVEPIMTAVAADRLRRRGLPAVWRGGTVASGGAVTSARRLAPLAAALAVGMLAGCLTVGGPWRDPAQAPGIAAADVSRGVASAASRVTAYHAVFAITEHEARRERNLTMSVWFHAPERFRLDIVDHDAIAASATSDDLTFVVNGDESYTRTPSLCPVAVPRGKASSAAARRSREPRPAPT
jgi:hypothetical protein